MNKHEIAYQARNLYDQKFFFLIKQYSYCDVSLSLLTISSSMHHINHFQTVKIVKMQMRDDYSCISADISLHGKVH